MKNKEIENLLKQENNAPDILNNIKTPKTFVKKEKTSFVSRYTLKQRVVALSVACSLLVIAIITPLLIIFLGNGNGDGNGGMENYDKLVIKDFEQYDKIGVGVESTSASSTNGLGFISLGNTFASSGKKKHKLIGQKKNGEIEQLILKDMTTEEETTPSLEVTQIWSGKNFTIIKYSTWYESYIYNNCLFERQPNYQALYLIDNNTGKFYSLNNFLKFSIGRRNDHDSFVEAELAESNDSLIVFGILEKDFDYNYSSFETEKCSLFELKIVENELKIEKLISFKDYNFANYFVDRYSNIYIGGKYNATNGSLEYMYTRTYDAQVKGIKFTPSAILKASENYAIETITEELVFSQNKIVYTANGQYYYNEYGEKVTNDFSGFDYFHTKDTLIQKDGNTEFYYLNEWRWDIDQEKPVYYIEKLVWIDDTKFTIEEIIINDYTDNYVFTNNKIYFLKNEEVFSISIYDGAKESLVSDYLFNDIQTNNLGEVLFTAINKTDRQAVNGKINKEGEIEINFQKIKYDVLYIKPLN